MCHDVLMHSGVGNNEGKAQESLDLWNLRWIELAAAATVTMNGAQVHWIEIVVALRL
jgi:hypothetical protein